ncbi:MAG TPA: hypothetical protein VIM61_01490 [Chthoniobacterales bacterium]|jgi:putative transposase
MDEIGRHHPAHGVHITLREPTIVFLTVCTRGRQPWLACEEADASLSQIWTGATAWRVGRYLLMPDHLHLFCAPTDSEISLDAWVRYWKSQFRRTSGRPDWRWQTDHWDTRLRRGESYSEKWTYVCENPVRANLATSAEAWPHQGEIHHLPW